MLDRVLLPVLCVFRKTTLVLGVQLQEKKRNELADYQHIVDIAPTGWVSHYNTAFPESEPQLNLANPYEKNENVALAGVVRE